MDQTVAELGQQHRADLSQGEMADASAEGQSHPKTEAPSILTDEWKRDHAATFDRDE